MVDDDLANRKLLHRVLTRQGHDVLMAEQGKEALQVIQSKEVHLMVADYEMPGMNGYDLITVLRTLPKYPRNTEHATWPTDAVSWSR